jgi:hypothetical protein
MELKWILAIALEAGFWLMLAAFLILRYRYGMDNITRLFVAGVVIDTAGIVALGVWDFVNTGNVNTYTAFIAALVIYGVTSGKEHFVALDRWMARKIKPKHGRQRAGSRPLPDRC